MTEPPLLIPVDASPFHLRVRHLWTEMGEARADGGKRKSGEEESEGTREKEQGRILLFLCLLSFSSPRSFLYSSPLSSGINNGLPLLPWQLSKR